MADQYTFHEEKRSGGRHKASPRQVEQARNHYPKTPEHFRQTVERAVAAQAVVEERLEGKAAAAKGSASQAAKGRGSRKRRWGRILLPAAATLALGCGALAAGNLWLKPYLMERGFSEEEAGKVIVTEPGQQTGQAEDNDLNRSAKKMDWEEPLLDVREAYFDGSTLYFMAEGSPQSQNYDLYLRDHGSINGHDGMASLQKLEDGAMYMGRIDLTDPDAGKEILEADTAQVEMTAAAYQKYEGRVFCIWKDEEAYQEIYGTGAFTSEYFPGTACYALPAEDVINGYTPQRITVQVSMTDEAKEIIQRYLAEGTLTWDTPGNVSSGAEEAGSEKGGETQESRTGHGEERELAAEDAGESLNQTVKIEGTHVSGALQMENDSLAVDGEITQMEQKVYTGTLRAEAIEMEKLKSLQGADSQDQWQETIDGGWRFGDWPIFVSSDIEAAHYQNDALDRDGGECGERAPEGGELEFCRQLLAGLGKETLVKKRNWGVQDETVSEYEARTILEGLPVVPVSTSNQWSTANTIMLENGCLSGLYLSSNLTVTEKEEARLLDLEEILARAGEYAASGEISVPENAGPVTEISLEYYVEMTREGLAFRPAWTFWYAVEMETDGNRSTLDQYFCMDAATGALIRDAFGY